MAKLKVTFKACIAIPGRRKKSRSFLVPDVNWRLPKEPQSSSMQGEGIRRSLSRLTMGDCPTQRVVLFLPNFELTNVYSEAKAISANKQCVIVRMRYTSREGPATHPVIFFRKYKVLRSFLEILLQSIVSVRLVLVSYYGNPFSASL